MKILDKFFEPVVYFVSGCVVAVVSGPQGFPIFLITIAAIAMRQEREFLRVVEARLHQEHSKLLAFATVLLGPKALDQLLRRTRFKLRLRAAAGPVIAGLLGGGVVFATRAIFP